MELAIILGSHSSPAQTGERGKIKPKIIKNKRTPNHKPRLGMEQGKITFLFNLMKLEKKRLSFLLIKIL